VPGELFTPQDGDESAMQGPLEVVQELCRTHQDTIFIVPFTKKQSRDGTMVDTSVFIDRLLARKPVPENLCVLFDSSAGTGLEPDSVPDVPPVYPRDSNQLLGFTGGIDADNVQTWLNLYADRAQECGCSLLCDAQSGFRKERSRSKPIDEAALRELVKSVRDWATQRHFHAAAADTFQQWARTPPRKSNRIDDFKIEGTNAQPNCGSESLVAIRYDRVAVIERAIERFMNDSHEKHQELAHACKALEAEQSRFKLDADAMRSKVIDIQMKAQDVPQSPRSQVLIQELDRACTALVDEQANFKLDAEAMRSTVNALNIKAQDTERLSQRVADAEAMRSTVIDLQVKAQDTERLSQRVASVEHMLETSQDNSLGSSRLQEHLPHSVSDIRSRLGDDALVDIDRASRESFYTSVRNRLEIVDSSVRDAVKKHSDLEASHQQLQETQRTSTAALTQRAEEFERRLVESTDGMTRSVNNAKATVDGVNSRLFDDKEVGHAQQRALSARLDTAEVMLSDVSKRAGRATSQMDGVHQKLSELHSTVRREKQAREEQQTWNKQRLDHSESAIEEEFAKHARHIEMCHKKLEKVCGVVDTRNEVLIVMEKRVSTIEEMKALVQGQCSTMETMGQEVNDVSRRLKDSTEVAAAGQAALEKRTRSVEDLVSGPDCPLVRRRDFEDQLSCLGSQMTLGTKEIELRASLLEQRLQLIESQKQESDSAHAHELKYVASVAQEQQEISSKISAFSNKDSPLRSWEKGSTGSSLGVRTPDSSRSPRDLSQSGPAAHQASQLFLGSSPSSRRLSTSPPRSPAKLASSSLFLRGSDALQPTTPPTRLDSSM